MEPTALKLVMVDGPRKGETLDFQPRSTIRIGRVVRGNNVTIKDSGISSKHLLIGCESGKWTVQDLDSSNGTALNSSQLPPFTPFDLSDRDTVKLGEFTSIIVHFDDFPSQLRRNPRRKPNQLDKVGSVAKVKIKTEEKTEVTLDNVEKLEESAPVEEKPRRGRQRKDKFLDRVPEVDKESENVGAVAEVTLDNVEKLEESAAVEEKPRRGRLRKGGILDRVPEVIKESENVGAVAEVAFDNVEKLEESAPVEEKPRRGRARKGRVLDRVPEVVKVSENVGAVAEKPEITRSRKDDNSLTSDKQLENRGTVAEKPETESVNVRVTRSRRNNNCLISENLGGECGRMTRQGRGRRKNLQELPLEIVQVGVTEEKRADLAFNSQDGAREQANEVEVTGDKNMRDEDKKDGLDTERKSEDAGTGPRLKESVDQAQVNGSENLGLRQETVDLEEKVTEDKTIRDEEKKDGLDTERKSEDAGTGPRLKESGDQAQVNDSENLGLGKETVDWEKMTLGQWFDFMEVHLPKQITEATEEMIEGMRRKAELLTEYMIEQKKSKA
ncbi:FHA domain-containing protein At4g14490-like [Euphorbia lathyris]|uniref:FHA domain-containing protein At4g14490-like n=1 Tax=Euphorbia lathyris TaxID=212925 RepID=UPI003313A494